MMTNTYAAWSMQQEILKRVKREDEVVHARNEKRHAIPQMTIPKAEKGICCPYQSSGRILHSLSHIIP